MSRRMFDHLFAEISVSVGVPVPRYELWLRVHDLGCRPDDMTRDDALRFLDEPLDGFLSEHARPLSSRDHGRLRRQIARFNPEHPTPYERFESWG